jgi:hypothetical protein
MLQASVRSTWHRGSRSSLHRHTWLEPPGRRRAGSVERVGRQTATDDRPLQHRVQPLEPKWCGIADRLSHHTTQHAEISPKQLAWHRQVLG